MKELWFPHAEAARSLGSGAGVVAVHSRFKGGDGWDVVGEFAGFRGRGGDQAMGAPQPRRDTRAPGPAGARVKTMLPGPPKRPGQHG